MVSKGLAIGLAALFLSACGPASPYVIDQPQPDEIPPGRGVLSGKDGEFVIFGRSKSEAEGGAVSSATTRDDRLSVAAPVAQPRAPATYGVDFASYENADLAHRGWSQIRSKHGQILTGVQPYVAYGSLRGGQPRHHLFGKGLTREQAESLCSSLQQRNEYCAVVEF